MDSCYILAVDVGSTTIKCQVYNSRAEIVGQGTTQAELLYPKPGWIEIDPDFMWNAFLKVIKAAIRNAEIPPDKIVGLGLSSQRGTFLTWDRTTGTPFHNFISWNDLRADHLVKSWDNSYSMKGMRMGGKLLHMITKRDRFLGASVLRISNKHISMRLLWVLDNIPNLRENVLFGTIDTWLIWKLTGGAMHVTDYSMASSSALYDPYIKEWSGWAFSLFNIPLDIMPEIRDTSGDFGICQEDIFGVPIPILAVAGDQQAATFGHCCFDKGDMKCTIGTGTFFNINTGNKPYTSMAGLYPLIGWKYGDVTAYLAEGSSNDTGSAVVWAQAIVIPVNDKIARLINDASECESLAKSVTSSGGVYFIPGFSGLQAPINDDYACAGIIGIKYNTRKEEIVRALIESLAFRIKQLYDAIRHEVKFSLHDLRVDGGVSQNNFILQLIADLTGKTVDRPTHTDMSCLGVALFAGLAADVWRDQNELKALRVSEVQFKPQVMSLELQDALQQWARAVPRCLNWYSG